MINHKFEPLVARLVKSKQTEMQVAANTRSSMNTTKKELRGSTNVNLNSIDRIANYLGLNVEIRYIPRPKAFIPEPGANGENIY